MRITSYGYKVPEVGDNGSVVADAVEDSLDQVNSHSHDGLTSAALNLNAVVTQSQTLSASWTPHATRGYYRDITLPSGVIYDKNPPRLLEGSTKGDVQLTMERLSDGTFRVYTWDSTLTLVVVYR